MTRILNNSNLPQGIEDCWSFFVGWLMHDVQKLYIYIYIYILMRFIFLLISMEFGIHILGKKKKDNIASLC